MLGELGIVGLDIGGDQTFQIRAFSLLDGLLKTWWLNQIRLTLSTLPLPRSAQRKIGVIYLPRVASGVINIVLVPIVDEIHLFQRTTT